MPSAGVKLRPQKMLWPLTRPSTGAKFERQKCFDRWCGRQVWGQNGSLGAALSRRLQIRRFGDRKFGGCHITSPNAAAPPPLSADSLGRWSLVSPLRSSAASIISAPLVKAGQIGRRKNRFGHCAAVKWGQIACPKSRFGRYAAVKRG